MDALVVSAGCFDRDMGMQDGEVGLQAGAYAIALALLVRAADSPQDLCGIFV